MGRGGLDLVQTNSKGSPVTKDSMESLIGPFLKTCSRVAWPGGLLCPELPFFSTLSHFLGTVFPPPSGETQAAPFPPQQQHRQAQHAGHFIYFDFSTSFSLWGGLVEVKGTLNVYWVKRRLV